MSSENQSEHYAVIAQTIEYIDRLFPEEPDLIELAAHARLSEAHFHRIFKEIFIGPFDPEFHDLVPITASMSLP